jgi:two-component system cell cycle response regulator
MSLSETGGAQGSDPAELADGTTAITEVGDIPKLQEGYCYLDEPERAFLTVLGGADVGRMFPLEQGETTVGRSQRAAIRLDDDRISRVHLRLRLFGLNAVVEDMASSNGTFVNGSRVTASPLRDGDKIRLGERTILRFGFFDALDEQFQLKLYDAALRDPLTEVFNRRHLLEQLQTEIAYVKRHDAPLALVLFDIDHFKRINDLYGHVAGDRVLVEVAQRVGQMVRTEDLFARYGGDEFAVLCRGLDLEGARQLAQRLHTTLEGTLLSVGPQRLQVTISAGVAAMSPSHLEATELVKQADAALYRAKHLGRNQVVVVDGSWSLAATPATPATPDPER